MKLFHQILGLAACAAYHAKPDESAGGAATETGKTAKAEDPVKKAKRLAAERAKKLADEKAAPKPEGLVTVRVRGNQPIFEGGGVYHPAVRNKENGEVTKPAETFEVTPERYVQLVGSGRVEIVEEAD
jgi:hypothetical protein